MNPVGYSANSKRLFSSDVLADIDECVGGKCDSDSRCVNVDGGFRCKCPDGYYQHYYWNQCVDDDECSKPGICGSAQCSNTVGGFHCTCPQGYTYDEHISLCIGIFRLYLASPPRSFQHLKHLILIPQRCPEAVARDRRAHSVAHQAVPVTPAAVRRDITGSDKGLLNGPNGSFFFSVL